MLDKTDKDLLYTAHRWTSARIALLGCLVGQGWDAARIAKHPLIDTTVNNIHRQVQRFGLSFTEARNNSALNLKISHREIIEKAALKRGLTYEMFIQYILVTLAKEPTLLDNILDDGE